MTHMPSIYSVRIVECIVNPSEEALPLTESEQRLRDRFVEEYLDDYDVLQAAIRCGFSEQFARDYGKRFMTEPYTLSRIKERSKELGVDTEIEGHRRRMIAMLYREANDKVSGSGGSRVSALSQLSKILGLDAPVKTQQEVKVTGFTGDLSNIPVDKLEEMKKMLYAPTPSPAPAPE